MAFSRSLLIKGLGACTVCVGGVLTFTQKDKISALFSPSSRAKIGRVGLECGEPGEEGNTCTLKAGGKILVKKDSGHFEVTDLGGGVIRIFKDDGYEESFKFVVEGEGIAGATDGNKMEEFETYEVKLGTEEDGAPLKDNYYFSRKTDSKSGIKNALGLPNEGCDLPNDNAETNCDISNGKLGTIKFDGGTATVTGTVTLTISRDTTGNDYPLGYKFTFKNTGTKGDASLTIGGTPITLKKNSPVAFKIKKKGSSLTLEKAWTLEVLAEKVGIKKENDGYWFVKEGGMNVELNGVKKTNKVKYSNPTGRIKVYEGEGYNEGLKFTIEKGDLDLKENKNNDSAGTINLGQFQSFEIVKESDGTWYLSLKEGDQKKIKGLLGLPCELPTSSSTSSNCDISGNKIGTIKFEGAGGGTPSIAGSPKLTIYKVSGRFDYPLGYKFTFTSTQGDSSITIPSAPQSPISLKKGVDIDYKIKISDTNENDLTLEKAWTAEKLMDLADLKKNSNESRWHVGDGGVNIKHGTKKSEGATPTGNKQAKIKVHEGVPGYNQGFKFVIEDGDTNLTGMGPISKYETYEVSADEKDGYWYFTRKLNSSEGMREILGIPDACKMPTTQTPNPSCVLDSGKLNGIKFEGKGDRETTMTGGTGTITLKISKATDTASFPKGYKFTFSSDQYGFTIPQSSGDINIKKGTNTEFKIKELGNVLTLERAWTPERLGGKINLTGCNVQEKKCSFGEKINVYEGDEKYIYEAGISGGNGKKISYLEEQENYNQGIKFYLEEEEEISLQEGNGAGGSTSKPTTIGKNSDGTTYQIMEKNVGGTTKWYLVKKNS